MRPIIQQNIFKVIVQQTRKTAKKQRSSNARTIKSYTLRKPKGELEALARLRIMESFSEGDRIGVETLSDPTSIIQFANTILKS